MQPFIHVTREFKNMIYSSSATVRFCAEIIRFCQRPDGEICSTGTRVVAVSCGANVGAASLEAMLAMANR